MLVNTWTIALFICSALTLLLLLSALATAAKVLLWWAPDQDTNRQITLENKTWLAAHLVAFCMALQLLSLFLLLLAADSYSHILVGAMCAAGAFVANNYGMPVLLVKIAGVFVYGFWLTLHHLDGYSEYQPLTKVKFAYLFFLLPFCLVDLTLLFLYHQNLRPDIITSCCGVVFGPRGGDGYNLIAEMSAVSTFTLFFGFALLLLCSGWYLRRQMDSPTKSRFRRLYNVAFAISCLLFLVHSLLAITAVISPLIYDLPNHRCPFDIFDKQYFAIGYPLYATLFFAVFFGMSGGISILFDDRPGLYHPVYRFRRFCWKIFFFCLPLFLLLAGVYPLARLLRLAA
jgi:hypothetical protein